MEKLKSPGIPARDASSVALADESMAMNVPATKVTASKTPRIEETERRRLRRTSRAAGPRRLTAKAVRKGRWLDRAKNILRIGGYDARCGGSIRLAAAGMDWSSRHGPHGGGLHARGPQQVHDVREVPNHPGRRILESRRARRGRPFRSAAFRQRIRCEWERPVRLSPRERERSDNGAGELYRFRDAP